MAAVPFLVDGGLLKKNWKPPDWKPPESKRYRADVSERLNLPLSFVSTKHFGDLLLVTWSHVIYRVGT